MNQVTTDNLPDWTKFECADAAHRVKFSATDTFPARGTSKRLTNSWF